VVEKWGIRDSPRGRNDLGGGIGEGAKSMRLCPDADTNDSSRSNFATYTGRPQLTRWLIIMVFSRIRGSMTSNAYKDSKACLRSL
jgi:hypothetical protein